MEGASEYKKNEYENDPLHFAHRGGSGVLRPGDADREPEIRGGKCKGVKNCKVCYMVRKKMGTKTAGHVVRCGRNYG